MKSIHFALLTVAVAAGCDPTNAQPTACDAYAACCATLDPAARSSCEAQTRAFKNYTVRAQAEAVCANAVAQLQYQGYCMQSTSPSTTILPGFDAGVTDGPATTTTTTTTTTRDAGAQCALRSIDPTDKRCQPATATCVAQATTDAARQACYDTDPDCNDCVLSLYDHCVIGDETARGRCAGLYGCFADCVDAECGPDAQQDCVDMVIAGKCASLYKTFDTCWDPSLTINKACSDGAFATCFPTPPATCGNRVVEPGETCDGNCPTCPRPTDPCITVEQTGDAAHCNVVCKQTPIPNCSSSCPLNPGSPSSTVGQAVFSGTFMERVDVLGAASGCGNGRDAVYAWRAPAAGAYTFSLLSLGTFASFGSTLTRTINMGDIRVMTGTCASGSLLACDALHQTVRVTLTAGQDVLVAAARIIDTTMTDGVYDLTAPYQIDIATCTPDCTGKTCGDNGCGGSCGTCGLGTTCSSGTCKCAPNCTNKNCGDDGCGGSCGTCSSTSTCSLGRCVCTPSCAGKTCGSNGCGGSCGTCGLGTTCSGTTCVSNPDACDPVANAGCASPNECILLSTEQTRCVLVGSGTQGSTCSSTTPCDGGYSCFAGTCRKICDKLTDSGCPFGFVCNGVSGWITYGACAPSP